MLPYILAARPKTLPAAVVPVWVGTVLTWVLSGHVDGLLVFCTLFGAICIQIATNFFNDAIDHAKGADTEKRLGPQRVTSSGLMSRKTVMTTASVFLLLATACGIVLIRAAGWPILAIGIPSLYFAYGYTGGPVPLAYRGLGELFVIIFFGFVAVAGTVYVQTLRWPAESFLLGAQTGLLSAVLISINNLRDREEDASTGKRTLAVRFGGKFARLMILWETKLAVFLGLLWMKLGHPFLALASLPILMVGLILDWFILTMPEGKQMNRLLALAALQLVLFAVVFHITSRI